MGHLDEFQKAEIGLKMEKLIRKLAEARKKAINKRFHGDGDGVGDVDGEGQGNNNNNITSEIRSVSGESHGIDDGQVEEEEQRGKPRPFTYETARDAVNKRRNPGLTEGHDASMPCASRDAQGI